MLVKHWKPWLHIVRLCIQYFKNQSLKLWILDSIKWNNIFCRTGEKSWIQAKQPSYNNGWKIWWRKKKKNSPVSFPNSSGIHVRTHRMEEISRCCTAGSWGENPYSHQAVNSQLIITFTQYLPCQPVENAFLQISTHSIVKQS